MKKLSITFGLLILVTGIVYGQTPGDLEAEFNRLHNQLLEYAANDQNTPAELETRYFELERILYPDNQMRIPDDNLDQGSTSCPGDSLYQPEIGSDTLVLFDYGNTNGFTNNCGWPECGRGPDVFYTLFVTRQDCVMISTCGSAFDTKLCVFEEDPTVEGLECCNLDYLYAQADSSVGVCDRTGRVSTRAVIMRCFTPGEYHIVLDGQAGDSKGSYTLRIEFFNNDCITPEPKPECPATFIEHEEFPGSDEEPCGFHTVTACDSGYCGMIDGPGDLDVYQIFIPDCNGLRVHLWANDTEHAPGGTAFGEGLNGNLKLYMTSCEALIAENGDIGTAGIPPVIIGGDAPQGRDSQLNYGSVVSGVPYYIVVGGEDDGLTGPYELLIECYNCDD